MAANRVLVTGGGTGIGRALVVRLAKAGHRVITVGRRINPLISVKKECEKNIEIIQADVSKIEGRQSIGH